MIITALLLAVLGFLFAACYWHGESIKMIKGPVYDKLRETMVRQSRAISCLIVVIVLMIFYLILLHSGLIAKGWV